MTKKKLRLFIVMLIVLSLLLCPLSGYATEQKKPAPYSNVYFGKSTDLSGFDFSNDYGLITTFNFGTSTKWPENAKMPSNFSPEKYMQWAKNPGLGINSLHKLGYTGKGVNIAYVDQNLSKKTHGEFKNLDVHYYNDILKKYNCTVDENGSMHGPSVLSLMSGKEIGVAPAASVYFVANPAWLTDQRTHADSIRKIIQINKQLASDKKIKVIGFSDNIDPSESYPEELEKAVREAEEQGIYVLFCGEFNRAVAEPFSDRDNPDNYYAIDWNGNKIPYQNNRLYIPVDRTTALFSNEYIKWSAGGLSWTAPYVEGLMAIGWQINPKLSAEELLEMMYKSAHRSSSMTRGGLINPEGFVELVETTVPKAEKDYKLFVYNSSKVTKEDLESIKAYCNKIKTYSEDVKLLDVYGLNDGISVYNKIKETVKTSSARLTGLQIFGTAEDVPAMKIQFKIQMQKGVDEGGYYLSDYFYGNVENESRSLQNFSVYSAFSENRKIDFIQDWPVVRLPLKKGDYSKYFAKAASYSNELKNKSRIPLINFSNPIFMQKIHSDDMGYFIKNRIDKEFGILSSKQYRLYGNQKGEYPVTTKVKGDFTAENLKIENERGIADFLINSHGQKTNIDRAYFENGSEKRASLINVNNINEVLETNYYNLMTWTCNNGYDIDDKNLTYKAMAEGKAVNVFSATSVLSNNGVRNNVSLDQMKKNNFYYFYYSFMKNYYGGMNRSDSFWMAKRAYVSEILKNSDVIQGEGNYQFNLNNALIYHHFGLIEYDEPQMGSTISTAGKISNGKAYSPAVATLKELGYKVTYNKKNKKLVATNESENRKIIITVGKKTAYVNGKKIILTDAPKLINKSVYFPVGSINTLTGCKTSWNKKEKEISIFVRIPNGHSINYVVKVN